MENKLAKLISAVSSPFVLVLGFGLWAIAAVTANFHDFFIYGALCVFFIGAIPFLYILVNVKLGHITDMHVAVREQRGVPFLVATAGAILLSLFYSLLQAPHDLVVLAVTMATSGIIFGLITTFWKISVHAASYTGSVLIVYFLISPKLLWLLIFLPAIIWARLVRKRHSLAQAIGACVLIALCVTVTFLLLR